MSTETKPRRSDPWVNPPSPGDKPEPGYEEHVRKSIEDGRAGSQPDSRRHFDPGLPSEDCRAVQGRA